MKRQEPQSPRGKAPFLPEASHDHPLSVYLMVNTQFSQAHSVRDPLIYNFRYH